MSCIPVFREKKFRYKGWKKIKSKKANKPQLCRKQGIKISDVSNQLSDVKVTLAKMAWTKF